MNLDGDCLLAEYYQKYSRNAHSPYCLRGTLKIFDQLPYIQEACSIVQVAILERALTMSMSRDDVAKWMRQLVDTTYAKWRNSPSVVGLSVDLLSDDWRAFILESSVLRSAPKEVRDAIPLVVATGDPLWMRQVIEALELQQGSGRIRDFDLCGQRRFPVSNAQKAVLALLKVSVSSISLDLESIASLAAELEAIGPKCTARKSSNGSGRLGDNRGNLPCQGGEFETFIELAFPEVARIDWKQWGKTDRYYAKDTRVGTEPRTIIIMNVGSNIFGSIFFGWEAFRDLMLRLKGDDHIKPNSIFDLRSHGVSVAFFTIDDLKHVNHPLIDSDAIRELKTPMQRLLGILLQINRLSSSGMMSAMGRRANLFQGGDEPRRRAYENSRVVLVTEADSAPRDLALLQRHVGRQSVVASVYRVISEIGEVLC